MEAPSRRVAPRRGHHLRPAHRVRAQVGCRARPCRSRPCPELADPREREVAALVAEGMSNRQIAAARGRSSRTVDGHVENILAKLGYASRARIAAWWAASQEPHPVGQPRRNTRAPGAGPVEIHRPRSRARRSTNGPGQTPAPILPA
ncbi:response regulator transcription factor [Streptomyces sp. SP18BB07]|uniref:response regulator transcription factor n=1 Tax=Streptomyces sp. SP18BB07 TaxID=3002522 RepID=UPI002E769A5D|nr:LuxR C-terminal-related transcriptional regulator [Streptomyces sp. SP18BB07]MEE1761197.1 LuxR C-terminal-related transcriptional regulator [Streptomyces sp. SP18BB07]